VISEPTRALVKESGGMVKTQTVMVKDPPTIDQHYPFMRAEKVMKWCLSGYAWNLRSLVRTSQLLHPK